MISLKTRRKLASFRWSKVSRVIKVSLCLIPALFFLFWPSILVPVILLFLDTIRVEKKFSKELGRIKDAGN